MVGQKQKVAIIGSGNWYVFFRTDFLANTARGSAIAKIAGRRHRHTIILTLRLQHCTPHGHL